jgi:fructose-bisphosphate aldolase class II
MPQTDTILPASLYTAAYGRYAIGHFNVANAEQIMGVFNGAVTAQAPVILALSRAAWAYLGNDLLLVITAATRSEFPQAVVCVHHDHGTEETCSRAIETGGYDSVMIDASHLPFQENLAITRRVVDRAHAAGISVEAELGVLAGVEDDLSVREDQALLTDPDQVAEFVARTGVDSLAVAVGTSHGAYKFNGASGLRLERLAEINRAAPGFPLVLHGASNVDPSEVARINAAGGALAPGTQGVDEDQLREAVRYGVTKVNFGTDGRLVWTRVHREFFRDHPERFDFTEPGVRYIRELAEMVAHKCQVLGSAGRLDEVRAAEASG